MQCESLLIVFVKAPRAGLVKTRLAGQMGSAAACAAYQRLVRTVLSQIDSLPNVQLRYSPDDAKAEVRPWQKPVWTMAPQGAGDLGARLTRAFSDAFKKGASRVAIIGSDCPWLSAEDIQQAWDELDSNDVVLGPACDGGYWLIALREPLAELFTRISWSTPNVLKQTVARAEEQRLRLKQLRELRDVDTLEDWRAFTRDNSFAQDAPIE